MDLLQLYVNARKDCIHHLNIYFGILIVFCLLTNYLQTFSFILIFATMH